MYSNCDYDRYLTEKQAEYEDRCNKPVETCFECDEDLYENEEYDGDYFYYTNTYLIGDYKIMFNSSKYIKDQCICDLQLDSIDIYKI